MRESGFRRPASRNDTRIVFPVAASGSSSASPAGQALGLRQSAPTRRLRHRGSRSRSSQDSRRPSREPGRCQKQQESPSSKPAINLRLLCDRCLKWLPRRFPTVVLVAREHRRGRPLIVADGNNADAGINQRSRHFASGVRSFLWRAVLRRWGAIGYHCRCFLNSGGCGPSRGLGRHFHFEGLFRRRDFFFVPPNRLPDRGVVSAPRIRRG